MTTSPLRSKPPRRVCSRTRSRSGGEDRYAKRLSDLVRVPITDGIREKGANVQDGVPPYIRVLDLTTPALDPSSLARTTHELAAANRSSRMDAGDIAIVLRSQIGLSYVVPDDLAGCNLAQGVGRIAPDHNLLADGYLLVVLGTPQVRSALDRISKGDDDQGGAASCTSRVPYSCAAHGGTSANRADRFQGRASDTTCS